MKGALKRLWLSFIISIMTIPVRTFATSVDGGTNGSNGSSQSGLGNFGENGNYNIDSDAKSSFVDKIESIFSSDTFGIGEKEIATGQKIAQPIIDLINTFTIALYLIVVFIFFGQTAVDLFYIFCPIVRCMMEKRAENKGFGDGRSAGSFCISESAYEAVHGSGSSGGLGNGGGERSYGTAILKYCGTRIGELAVFIFFTILFIGGMIGQIIIAVFYLLSPVIESLMSIGG